MSEHPRHLNAGNQSPFTLGGTRTYLVGRRRVAVLDPGPDVEDHVRGLCAAVSDADEVTVLLTHGHGDHAAAAPALARALDAPVRGPAGVDSVDDPLAPGQAVETDQGRLVAVDTPGHSRHHFCYHWPEASALFAGDLLLGEGDTTWVGEYPGCVADYLASLDRVEAVGPDVIYPAHGEALEDVPGVLERYRAHRRERIRQVREALEERPGATGRQLLEAVYGDSVPSAVKQAALMSVEALLDYVRSHPEG